MLSVVNPYLLEMDAIAQVNLIAFRFALRKFLREYFGK